ncbi:zinc finger (C3HC4-type RING finger) family protein [Striga asiatica]|uniref:Zinc finger (C3HC4-type RING finger) family protein n=1 Tax=Striga asiatica TaxID=4170 RepID=A0A5A7QAH6_STRAF|nr:zinc finger (C3HC4-type RING finger) family protein [Striga asiatica]
MSSFSDADFSVEGIDDVQDYPWESVEGSMSWEKYTHLSSLVHTGNKAFRENRLDQAIESYSRANNINELDPIILSNRAAAYIRASHFLKHRPPTASEYRPLSGSDPTTHAALAVKDVEKVMTLQSGCVTPYILKANALILLEKYELARDVIRSGLQIDPQSTPLLNLEKSTSNIFMRRSHVKPQRTDDYDCTLCLKLLYEPVTTPCGHSFCRSCLFQCMDRGNRCPLCRTVMLISPRTCAISVTLNNIIQKNFPEEYAERKLENDSLTNPGADMLPLFVMDVIIPCQKFQLNIFEPRYRLMNMYPFGRTLLASIDLKFRLKCLETGEEDNGRKPSHGNVASHFQMDVSFWRLKAAGDVASFGIGIKTVIALQRLNGLKIHIHQRDPREMIFWGSANEFYADQHLWRTLYQIGYLLLEMTQKAAEFASQWIKDAQGAAQGDRVRLAELFKAEGMKPPTRDPERFSFWLATLSNRRPSERLDLLRLRDTKEVLLLATSICDFPFVWGLQSYWSMITFVDFSYFAWHREHMNLVQNRPDFRPR